MTLQEKIAKSRVISSSVRPRSSQGLMTGKKRINSLLYFLLLAGYTIVNNFILNDPYQLGYSMFFIIGNLITLCMLTFMSQSIFSKQHIKTYKFVNFLNKLFKLLIFVVTFISYYRFYRDYFIENPLRDLFAAYGVVKYADLSKEIVLMVLENLILVDPAKFFGFLVTIFTGIPVLVYFLIMVVKYYIFYLFFPIIIIHWLFTNSKLFYQYEYVDEERVRVVIRRIDSFGYSFFVFIKKLIILAFGTVGVFVLIFILAVIFAALSGNPTSMRDIIKIIFPMA